MEELDVKLIIRFLLGDLSKSDEERLLKEEVLFEGEFLDLCDQVEDGLIDDYLFGRLSPRDRELFQANFLIYPERVKKLQFADVLMKTVLNQPLVKQTAGVRATSQEWPRQSATQLPDLGKREKTWRVSDLLKSPRLAWSLLALACLTIGILYFQGLNQSDRLQSDLEAQKKKVEAALDQLSAERARHDQNEIELTRLTDEISKMNIQREDLEEQLKRLRAAPFDIATAVLFRSGSRSDGETVRVKVSSQIRLVRLLLPLDNSTKEKTFRVIVDRGGDQKITVENRSLLRRSFNGRAYLILELPPSALKTADYKIILQVSNGQAFEDVASFPVRIIKNQ